MAEEMTPQRIRELLERPDWNQTRVADYFGVTRQAVSAMLGRHDMRVVTNRQKALEAFPWRIVGGPQEQNCPTVKRLRDHLEFYATGGAGMNPLALKRLLNFYGRLEVLKVVIEYTPQDGFVKVPRREEDGDLIIRLNEYAKVLDDMQVSAWRRPRVLPKVVKRSG